MKILIVETLISSIYFLKIKYHWIFLTQITGTGHGIGKELALKYAILGATVVCLDINEAGNEETVNEIKKLGAAAAHGYKSVFVYLDI